MLALVVCGKHWYGFLSSASPTSQRENAFQKSVTLINTPETDDSGADY